MAALAAEKLKKQKSNEFQSDSNLACYSAVPGSNQTPVDCNGESQTHGSHFYYTWDSNILEGGEDCSFEGRHDPNVQKILNFQSQDLLS